MSEMFAIELRSPDGLVLLTFMLAAESSLLCDLPWGHRPSGLVELWVGRLGDRTRYQRLGEPFSLDDQPLMVSGPQIAALLEWHSDLVGIRMEKRA